MIDREKINNPPLFQRLMVGLLTMLLILLNAGGQLPITNAAAEANQTQTGKLNYQRAEHQAVSLAGGKVLIVGGNVNAPVAEVYNPADNTTTTTGTMVTPRAGGLTATLLSDGRVLIAGGTGQGNSVLNSAELYDPNTNSFTAAGNMNSKRGHHTAVLLNDGKVLVAGGADAYTDSQKGTTANPLTSAELFDPISNSFSPLTAKMTADNGKGRYTHNAVRLNDGSVLLLAGSSYYNYLKTANIYNPTTSTFSPAGSMKEGRAFRTAAVLLKDNRVLIGGGYNGRNLASMEIYNPSAGTFAATTSLRVPHKVHTMTTLDDGKVLITGGIGDGQSVQHIVEIYDPADASVSLSAPLSSPRQLHTATLLNGGKVLIAGGYNQQSMLDTLEVYTPQALPEVVAEPVFSLKEGTYIGQQIVELSCSTAGANIYYTTDGSEPSAASASSTLYTGAIKIAQSKVLKAVAIKGASKSGITSATYTINWIALSKTSSWPAADTNNILVDRSLTVNFNLPLQKGTTFDQIILNKGAEMEPITATISGSTVTVAHTSPLLPNKEYSLQIPAGALNGPEGQSLGATVIINFKTLDTTKVSAVVGGQQSQMDSPYNLTDSDTDHVYFHGDTLSVSANFMAMAPSGMSTGLPATAPPGYVGTWPPPGSATIPAIEIPGFNGTLRFSLGIYKDAGVYDATKPVLAGMTLGSDGNYYKEVTMANGAFSFSGTILNPDNTTLPTGIVALKMIALDGDPSKVLVPDPVPLMPADKKVALVGLPIPRGDFSISPDFSTIKNFYNTEVPLELQRSGYGSITLPSGLNMIDSRDQLWALKDNMVQGFSADLGGLVSGINTDSISFLANTGATLSLHKAMSRLQIADPNITTEKLLDYIKLGVVDNNEAPVAPAELASFIDVATLRYDAATDTLSFPVKHFTKYIIKKKDSTSTTTDTSQYAVKPSLTKGIHDSLTAKFSQPVVSSTLTNDSIRVLDARGLKVEDLSVAVKPNTDGREVLISAPAAGWSVGVHTLFIAGEIGSVEGEGLKSGVKITFTVK